MTGSDQQSDENTKEKKFSLQAFARGLAVACLLYVFVGLAALFLFKPDNHAALSSSQTVDVVYQAPPVAAAPEQPVTGPAVPEIPLAPEPAEGPEEAQAVPVDPVTTETQEPSATINPQALAPAPIEGFFAVTPDGRIPLIRQKDNVTPFQAYRRPFDRQAVNQPVISIAITDIGLSQSASEQAVNKLPAAISLALSPYADNPDFWVNESRASGHEVWLVLPVESSSYPMADSGPLTLLVSAPEQENMKKLTQVMGKASGYAGVVTTSHPVFLQSTDDMRPIVTTLYKSGLGLADSSAQPSTTIQAMAMAQKAPYTNIDLSIDSTAAGSDVQAALAQLEAIAREHNNASAVFAPSPAAYEEILKWIVTLPDKGLVLAPLSAQTGL